MENSIVISESNGELVVSSRQVAKNFGKEHKHVLESVRTILAAENSATKFFYDKSRYSNKTVESFRYYYSAVDKFRDILKGA